MLQSVEGVFRDGKIELLETPPAVASARVIVTFLPQEVGQAPPALTPEEIVDLR